MSTDSTLIKSIDGKYQIENRLGGGGMGEVFRVRHLLLNQPFAIKKIKPEYSNDTEFKKRFFREAKAAGIVNHPNVCVVYDLVDNPQDGLFMVMEYIQGVSLSEKLRKEGAFSPHQAIKMLEPIAEALDAAHIAGVIHRDVKPSNIMIKTSEQGRHIIKLLDLGIAKLRPRPGEKTETSLTGPGQPLGSIPYISPEQLGIPQRDGKLDREGNIEIDGRADVYSLGIVFYELIAGRKPYQANHTGTLIHQITKMTPNPLYEGNSNIPVAFDQAIRKALSTDRADRQQTCEELIRDLKDALGLSEPSRWRRKLLWLLLIPLVGLAMWLGYLLCGHQSAVLPPDTPPPPPYKPKVVETGKGKFNIIVFNDGFNWEKGSDTVVQRNGVNLEDGLIAQFSTEGMRKDMGGATEIICLGTASVEAGVGLGAEVLRAGKRANQLADWIVKSEQFKQPLFTLNLGKFMGNESSSQTESQRRIVIIGVADKKTNLATTGEDIREAIRKYQTDSETFPIAFDNYSLTQNNQPLTLKPYPQR